jgi:hypothetical protein
MVGVAGLAGLAGVCVAHAERAEAPRTSKVVCAGGKFRMQAGARAAV